MVPHTFVLPIPFDTARAAQAVFGRGNFYLAVGDQAGLLFANIDLATLAGPGRKPHILFPLITLFQFLEDLPDLRSANAARMRTDWKYALHLPMDFPGLDPRELCRFRSLLLHEKSKLDMFQRFLDRLRELDLDMRCESPELRAGSILQKVCALSRLDEMVEAMHQALEFFASRHHEWLRTVTLPHWYERYYHAPLRFQLPRSKEDQESLAISVGSDAQYLIGAAEAFIDPAQVPVEIQNLFQLWARHFDVMEGQTVWRATGCTSCERMMA